MLRTTATRLGPACVLALVALTLSGCQAPQDRLVDENYGRLQTEAMTQADVREILGEPDNVVVNIWLYERPEKHLMVKLEFDESGRLQRKEWIDAASGMWEDAKDER